MSFHAGHLQANPLPSGVVGALTLTGSEAFSTGVVHLTYTPAR